MTTTVCMMHCFNEESSFFLLCLEVCFPEEKKKERFFFLFKILIRDQGIEFSPGSCIFASFDTTKNPFAVEAGA